MFTKDELFYIIDCLDQDYYNIKDIEDLELQRAELSKNARICSILSDLIAVSYTHLTLPTKRIV